MKSEKPIELKSHEKGYTFDQDKAIRPEKTVQTALDKIEAYDEKLIDSFERVLNIFNIPQYKIEVSEYVRKICPLLKSSHGKGVTESQARASCVMEFLERFSTCKYDKWEKHTCFELPPEETLPIESIAETLNYHRSDKDELLDELKSTPMLWGRAYNFSSKKYINVPKMFYDICTTGLAAGNIFEEALLQAICECVERHVGAHVQWFGGDYPTVDKRTIKNKVVLDLLAQIEKKDINVLIKDFSSILKIPVLGVLLIDQKNRDDIGHGIGVACDKDKALIRSLTESAQGPMFRTSLMLKNSSGSYFFKSYKEAEFLFKGPLADYNDVLDIRKNDIKDEVENCIEILSAQGRDVMCMDMTDEKLHVPALWVYLKNAYLVYANKSLLFHVATLHILNNEHDKIPGDIKKLGAAHEDDHVYYFYLGFYYEKGGKYKEAIDCYKKVIELNSGLGMGREEDRKNTIYHLGLCYSGLKKYDDAIKYLEEAIAVSPQNSAAHFYLAVAYQQVKRYSEAAECFEKSARLNMSPKSRGESHFRAGLCYMELRSYEKALDNLKKSETYGDGTCDLHYQKGVCQQRLGYFKEAIESYEKCLECDKANRLDRMMIYFQFGECYLELKMYDKAIEYLKMAEDKEEDRSLVFFKIGQCYQCKNSFKDAIPYFNKALGLSTEDARSKSIIYLQKAMSYLGIEEFELALENFQQAKELSPQDGLILHNIGVCYQRLGKYAKAVESFEDALKFEKEIKPEKQGEIYFHLGVCYAALEKFEEALRTLNAAEPKITEKRDLYFHIGVCYFKQSKLREAIASLEKALKNESPGVPDISIFLYQGLSYSMLSEYEKTIDVLERAVSAGGGKDDGGTIKYHLGMAHQALGRHDRAITYFEEAYKDSHNDHDRGEINYQIGFSRIETGDKKGAKEALGEAVKHKTERGESYNLLGMMFIEDGENDKAIDVLKKGIRQFPGNWENYNLLGVCYRNKGETATAVKVLEKAISINPGEWRNYNILGKIYVNLNAHAQALYMFEKAFSCCEDEKARENIKKNISVSEIKLKEAGN